MKNILFYIVFLFTTLSFQDETVRIEAKGFSQIIKENEKSTYKYYETEAKIKSIKSEVKKDSVRIKNFLKLKSEIADTGAVSEYDSIKITRIITDLKSNKSKVRLKWDIIDSLNSKLIIQDSLRLVTREFIYSKTQEYLGELEFEYKGHAYHGFIANLDSHEINTHWKKSNGQKHLNIGSVKNELSKSGDTVLCITNGGMYTPSNSPEGLLISNYKELEPIDTNFIPNLNFYMMPNGVFYKREGKADIKITKDYRNSKLDSIAYATQSGPMLLINGEHHPAFNYGSRSRKLRSGVGIRKNGNVVFLISKDRNVNFHEFATVFRELFNCEKALFLDGAISKMYLKNLNRNEIGGRFGPIISITSKN